jgi:uncharacterized PurR-regulated membrane protein YhhQ (DUF165 family)
METESETVFAKLAEQTHDIICKNRLKKKQQRKAWTAASLLLFSLIVSIMMSSS